jgi:peptide/nickel transport system ATP-binding protein
VTLLQVDDLTVTYPGPPAVRAVDALSLTVGPGECLGVLGESGSGKSTLARSLLGMVPGAQVHGRLRLDGTDLHTLDEAGWQAVRWQRIALVFQSTTALNPVLRVGPQITETLKVHLGMGERAADRRAEALLTQVGLGGWAASRYPRELSGGQRRLALLAMALSCDPDLLVLDEPTAGLDPVTRSEVLDLLRRIRMQGRSLLVLTHDVDALRALADRVVVLYRGWLAETGPAERVLDAPRHPYAWGLLNAYPTLATLKDLRGIRGRPPDPTQVAVGCPFADRCTQDVEESHQPGRPPLVAPEGEDGRRLVSCVRGGLVSVLEARDLRKTYHLRTGIRRVSVPAVDGISLTVREQEVVGLVGANGAGKSTLGMLLLRLLEPDGGTVHLEGRDLLAAGGEELKALRGRAQMLFQDPYEALSPRMTIHQALIEPLDVQGIGSPAEREVAIREAMAAVRLPPEAGFLERHTHELSGGQLQRVSLARALVLQPKLLIADEPVEGLDPSEQAKMLQLLKAVQVERGMAMVLVSHDLAVVLRVADRVAVLDRGRIVEENSGSQLLLNPVHAATRQLLAASGRSELLDVAAGAPGTDPLDHAPAST